MFSRPRLGVVQYYDGRKQCYRILGCWQQRMLKHDTNDTSLYSAACNLAWLVLVRYLYLVLSCGLLVPCKAEGFVKEIRMEFAARLQAFM